MSIFSILTLTARVSMQVGTILAGSASTTSASRTVTPVGRTWGVVFESEITG